MSKIFLLAAALGLMGAWSAWGQADSGGAPSEPVSDNPAAEAAWTKIAAAQDQILEGMQTRDQAGLESLVPPTRHELADFEKAYPHDAHSPEARMLAVHLDNLERQLQMPGAPGVAKIDGELAAIAGDDSLPRETRAEAALMSANLLMQAAQEKGGGADNGAIEKRIEAYQKQFGDVLVEGRMSGVLVLREGQLGLLKMEGDTAAYDALLARLSTDANPDVQALAQKARADEQTMGALKAKPVELAFTAVDGRKVDLAKLRGKVVLVDFWATWCGPCVEEMPDVLAAYSKYHGKGFEIVGISLDQDKAALEKFVADNHIPWPQYFDGQGWDNAISSRYGIQEIPAMWLVGRNGLLTTDDARDDLDGRVAKLLAAP